MDHQLTREQLDQIERALESGNKIMAIKVCREITGMGLKESKEYVDSFILNLKEQDPEKYVALIVLQGAGCRSTAIFFFGLTTGVLDLIIRFIAKEWRKYMKEVKKSWHTIR